MSEQLWAIVEKSGGYVLRYTASADVRPEKSGHADECKGRKVWPLKREPKAALGEVVSYATGEIEFNSEKAASHVVPAVKAWAQAEILAAVPYWRQLNDLADPEAAGVAERRKMVDGIRERSNKLEQSAIGATTARQIETIWQQIKRN